MHENGMSGGWSAADLLRCAVAGDQTAWRMLVTRYTPTVWAVARGHRLNHADAADVVQNTWIALAEKSHTIRDPRALAGWLATTARRQTLDLIASRRREVLVEQPEQAELLPEDPATLAALADRDDKLWRALRELTERCQRVLLVLAHGPELSAEQVAAATGLAPGSVARTKIRCLAELRRKVAIAGLFEEC